nr:Chain A, Glycosyltransferase [Siraitia grosvenorii]7BV3_B Chain B, Glycosyltransferase [Siraitia grosvenorii]
KVELVFVPGPGIGHLSTALQIADLLLRRDHRLSVTVLSIPLPWEAKTTTQPESLFPSSTTTTTSRIRFISLPQRPLPDDAKGPFQFQAVFETQKQNVKEAVAKLSDSSILAGLVLDMFCVTMVDVAKQLGVPSYVFFTSSAGYLSFTSHLQDLSDRHGKETQQLMRSDVEIAVPGFTNPVPGKVIPGVYFNKNMAEWLHDCARRFRETNGILVNTFSELESQVMDSFSDATAASQFPAVYAVGPILSLNKNTSAASSESQSGDEILKWLDQQPPSSVVFLCFGSKGSLNPDQAREIAHALERSGHRFVWSLRQPSPKGKFEKPIEYDNIEDVLPEGFLDRTAEMGRVIGWAPQVEILGHPATGGFVSHCGWNSTLESLWYGVPIATWPMYAEQHFNAFEMGVELGLAVGISSESSIEEGVIVSAEKIEEGIRKLMGGGGGGGGGEVRKLVKAKSEESRKSVMEGGSSFTSLNRFIDEVMKSPF